MAQRRSRSAPRSSRDRAREGDVDPRELLAAKRRVKASKLCAASLYAVAAMVPLFCLLGFLGTAVVGAVSVLLAIIGLVSLSKAGPPPVDADSQPGVVRLSARMYSGAKPKAWIGLILGVFGMLPLLLALLGLAALVAMEQP